MWIPVLLLLLNSSKCRKLRHSLQRACIELTEMVANREVISEDLQYPSARTSRYHRKTGRGTNMQQGVDGNLMRPRSLGRVARFALISLSLVTLVACAVPVEQLKSYNGAFQEARDSGTLIYAEMRPALASGGAATEATTTAEGSAATDAPAAPSVVDDDPFAAALGPKTWTGLPCAAMAPFISLEARCQAFSAVTGYNEILLRLASGETAAGVQSRIDTVFGLVNGLSQIGAVADFVSSATPYIAPLKAILGEAIKLQQALELRQKLEEGAPYIQGIITALHNDVARIYDVQRAYYDDQLQARFLAVADVTTRVYRESNKHRFPESAALIAQRSALVQRYETALASLDARGEIRPLDEAVNPEGTPFTDETAQVLAVHLDDLDKQVAGYVKTRGGWRTFVAALKAYDQMLEKLDQSFSSLLSASSDPFAAGGGVAQLIDSTVVVRDQAHEIRRLLKANPSEEATP